MKNARRSLRYNLWFTLFIGMIAVLAASPANAANCSTGDALPPQVQITPPAENSTNQPSITLSGDAQENCGLQMIRWSNWGDADPTDPLAEVFAWGYTSGNTPGNADAWYEWAWQTESIPLTEGVNHIVVTAEDTAGNPGEAAIDVTYTPESSDSTTPTIGDTTPLDPKKVKFTFYFGGTDYVDLDRGSIVAYLSKAADEEFVMPFDKDVTAIIQVPGDGDNEPPIQIFSQTIPAGTISGSSKYRYTGSPPGIRELTFMSATSTTVYAYLYLEGANFLPALRDSLTPEAYQAYIQSIDSFTLTLVIGGDKAWQGSAPLTKGSYGTHKQEMIYNR